MSETLDSITYLYICDVSECDVPTQTRAYESIKPYAVDQLMNILNEVSSTDVINCDYDTGWTICKFIKMMRFSNLSSTY
jgi:hypothetical protein